MGKSIASRFADIAVERSMLLGVVVDDDQLTLEMDFCLEPGHPAYEAPGEGEACCFHPGMIRFGGITTLNLERAEAPAGARRFAIQSFAIEGSRCDLACDWGKIHLQARSIRVLTE
ncbi:hypothetical protein [Qipengyuania sediminis]|uniref:hypothetical protein n=1 Tax=Qipengyuania sediminis TaxID=1532023 RepID=UPI00105955FC|nr:hypothetical protein [Qipengyuania sediminis]